jgi:uncharacterized protein YybS (DUF2232 family)
VIVVDPKWGIYRLVLFCTSLTYETTLCGLLKGSGHLFVIFPTFCIYFSTVFVYFESIVGKLIHFSSIGSATSSSFGIRSGKDPPCKLFLKSIRKKKYFYL